MMIFSNPGLSTRANVVYKYICDEIFYGRIKPGQVVDELDISKACNLSRTPTRQALKKLERDGIVELEQNKSAKIKKLGEEDRQHIGESRLLLDWMVARMVMFHGADADFIKLQNLADSTREMLLSDNLYDKIIGELTFHVGLAELVENDILLSMTRRIMLLSSLLQVERYESADISRKQAEYHDLIVQALFSRDGVKIKESIIGPIVEFFEIEQECVDMIFQKDRII